MNHVLRSESCHIISELCIFLFLVEWMDLNQPSVWEIIFVIWYNLPYLTVMSTTVNLTRYVHNVHLRQYHSAARSSLGKFFTWRWWNTLSIRPYSSLSFLSRLGQKEVSLLLLLELCKRTFWTVVSLTKYNLIQICSPWSIESRPSILTGKWISSVTSSYHKIQRICSKSRTTRRTRSLRITFRTRVTCYINAARNPHKGKLILDVTTWSYLFHIRVGSRSRKHHKSHP